MGLRRTTEKHSKQRLDGGRWSMTVLVAAMLPGCSFIFASGAPSEPITPATAQAAITDPPCTESTAWPWVDVVFTGVYSGMAAASSSGAIDMGLEGAIALLAGTAAHAFSAIHGFGKVGGCFAYMQAARTAARPVPAYVQNSPAFTGWTPAAGPTPTAPAPAANITMAKVRSLQRGLQTAPQLIQMFGEPLSRSRLPTPSPQGCVEVWTWLGGVAAQSALSVSLQANGTVCLIGVSGQLPP